MIDQVIATCFTKSSMRKFQEEQDGGMFGGVALLLLFYPSCNWNAPVDVLQSQCSNRLGKCLFLTISGMGRMVFAWVHHYMAQAMIVLLVLHLMQVVIDGAYRAPRELNFWFGAMMMGVTLALSLQDIYYPGIKKDIGLLL